MTTIKVKPRLNKRDLYRYKNNIHSMLNGPYNYYDQSYCLRISEPLCPPPPYILTCRAIMI